MAKIVKKDRRRKSGKLRKSLKLLIRVNPEERLYVDEAVKKDRGMSKFFRELLQERIKNNGTILEKVTKETRDRHVRVLEELEQILRKLETKIKA
jgi:hypothetical protein